MSNAHTREFTQYGLQYPAGAIKWATGSAQFGTEHNIPGDLVRVDPRESGGYPVDLADAKNGGPALSHLLGLLAKNCESVGADRDSYVAGCKIVTRKVLVVVTDGDRVAVSGIQEDGES